MENAKFWTGKKGNGSGTKIKKQKTGKSNALLKGLGITGVIVILIAAAIGAAGYIYVVKPAYALVSSANVLKSDSQSIADALQSRDLLALDVALSNADKHLDDLRNERENNFSWAKDIKTFKINEFYSDSDRLINAGHYGIDALREVSTVVTPFADAAGLKISEDQEVVEEEGLMEAFQSWISLMPEVAGQMDGVIEKVSKIGKEIEPINTEKYPEEFKGIRMKETLDFIKGSLANSDEYAPDIKQALTIVPRLLGVDTGEKRYMIIMQNDKELRPTGGFMTNYATFKINNALLTSDFSSKDMYSIDNTLDAIDAYYDFPDAPDAYMKYLKVERWYARDMNSDPDFPTSMEQLLVWYNKAGQINPYEIKPVDGIFAIDTYVIAQLLEATGPVTVNGITYTHENVVLELEKIASLELREQLNRKKVLGDLMEEMLINVFESDKNLWPKLIDTGVDLALKKHIQVYLFDEEAQVLIDKYGIGGRILPEVEGDYSSVISTNLGGDKTNWFVTKQVDHTLEREGADWVRTVSIKYSYAEPDGAYGPFIKRFRDWVRVYAPIGSQVMSVDGTEDGTVSENDTNLNKYYMTGFIELAPGEEKTMVFKYKLPAGVVGDDRYNLTIQKQAGIDSEIHTVTVNGKTQQIDLFKDEKITIKL